MATNDFLPFANGGGANVLTQAQYAALTALLSGGYQSGVANSAQMNKTWRQSSIMAAVLGQFAADYSGNNSVDDGTIATLEANLVAAIRSATKTGVILADTGAANAYTAVNAPPLVAGTWVDGVVQQVRIAHANTGASTYAPDGLTAIPIYGLGLQPLQGSELALNGIAILVRMTIAGVNSGNPIAVLMECAGGAQQVAPATQSQHAMQLGQATGRFLRAQTISVSSTPTYLAATTQIRFRLVGGGGAGGGAAATGAGQCAAGGGGGSAAWVEVWKTSGFSGQAAVIGAGGTGVAGTTGNSGGSSSFCGFTVNGGLGGSPMGATSTSVVSITAQGGPGAIPTGSFTAAGAGNVGAGGIAVNGNLASGIGAASIFGGAAPGISVGTPWTGQAAGAGGGGSAVVASSAASAGGAGAAGVLIIEEYA
ncbi:hypothetical protein [Paraburkholderia graminis]|uniref:hypothetical protein n=1 Tax=Paraburkholderia graminis TaxID=60548 RepID=UPI0038B6D09A